MALDGRLLRADDRYRAPVCAGLLEFPLAKVVGTAECGQVIKSILISLTLIEVAT